MKKKTTRKTTKKSSFNNDLEFSLKIPSNVAREFQRASQKIQKQYDYAISPELLMVWILSGVHEEYLIKEFEDALASQSAVENSRVNR